jgi:hypothetical protein
MRREEIVAAIGERAGVAGIVEPSSSDRPTASS